MGRVANKIALVTGAASVPGLGSTAAIRPAAGGATAFITDVDLSGVEKAAAGIRESGGNATALVHDVSSETDWDRVFYGTQRAVREMRRVGKGGIRMFTKSIALETTREGIRVNSLHAGMIWTNMQKVTIQDNKDIYDAITATIPAGRPDGRAIRRTWRTACYFSPLRSLPTSPAPN